MSTCHIALSVICLLAAQCVFGAESSSLPTLTSPTKPVNTIEDVDEDFQGIQEMPWQIPQVLGNPGPDETGRRVEDDLAEYFLTEPELAQITSLRATLAASNTAGAAIPAAELKPLWELYLSESCRINVIKLYWSKHGQYDFHREMIERLIDRLPEADRPAGAQQLGTLEHMSIAVRRQVAPAIQYCRDAKDPLFKSPSLPDNLLIFAKPESPLLNDLTAVRLKLAAQLDAARTAGTAPQDSLHRPTACPGAAPIIGGDQVKLLVAPDATQYYPAEAKSMDVTGLVRVVLDYDDSGCVVDATIRSSSGSDLLDGAALKMGIATVLLPAQENGKPVKGRVVLPIRFNLRGPDPAPPAPSAQPQP